MNSVFFQVYSNKYTKNNKIIHSICWEVFDVFIKRIWSTFRLSQCNMIKDQYLSNKDTVSYICLNSFNRITCHSVGMPHYVWVFIGRMASMSVRLSQVTRTTGHCTNSTCEFQCESGNSFPLQLINFFILFSAWIVTWSTVWDWWCVPRWECGMPHGTVSV